MNFTNLRFLSLYVLAGKRKQKSGSAIDGRGMPFYLKQEYSLISLETPA